jgi:hypothetical protein
MRSFINAPNIPKMMYKKRCIDSDRPIHRRFSSKFSKKGQVTIFIVLGLVILISAILIIVLRSEIISIVDEITPTSKGKVETFISSCIEDIANEALELIGLQSGYLNVPPQILQDGSQHLKLSPVIVVPYWAYGPNLNIIPLSKIKEDLDRHIEQNLRGCLLDSESFQETYDLVEKSDITSDTNIAASKIIYKVNWNVEIRDKSGEVISEVIEHLAESPVKLRRLHETATKLIEEEMRQMKFEDITQDLISMDHPNLPVSGLEVSCSKKEWKVSEVKSTLQDMLRVNIRRIKIEGTEFIAYPDEFSYMQNHYVWNLDDEFKRKDVGVVFHYDNNYPFTFQVTPNDAGKLKSGSVGGTDVLKYVCLQTWKFTYDVSYPVLIRVIDETTGYNFQTAFTVHLVRNVPNRGGEISARPSLDYNLPTDEKYCADRRIPMTIATWELVENEEQGIYDQQPLDDVNVSFVCIKYSCDMGQTDFDFGDTGYQAGFTRNFPYCVGGIIRAEKGGYKEDWKKVVTEDGLQTDLFLRPLFTFPANKIKVVKHSLDVGSKGDIGPAEELEKGEVALIRLSIEKDGEIFHESQIIHTMDQDPGITKRQNLEFMGQANFKYQLQVDVFGGDTFVGGYKSNWTADWTELSGSNELIFHVGSQDGSDEEKFDFMFNIEEKSKLVPEPELR